MTAIFIDTSQDAAEIHTVFAELEVLSVRRRRGEAAPNISNDRDKIAILPTILFSRLRRAQPFSPVTIPPPCPTPFWLYA
jgi:hypothetical protein